MKTLKAEVAKKMLMGSEGGDEQSVYYLSVLRENGPVAHRGKGPWRSAMGERAKVLFSSPADHEEREEKNELSSLMTGYGSRPPRANLRRSGN